MLFRELSGILVGSATVSVDTLGYNVSHEDVEVLIDTYGDHEVFLFSLMAGNVGVFDPQDFSCEGSLFIHLG